MIDILNPGDENKIDDLISLRNLIDGWYEIKDDDTGEVIALARDYDTSEYIDLLINWKRED